MMEIKEKQGFRKSGVDQGRQKTRTRGRAQIAHSRGVEG